MKKRMATAFLGVLMLLSCIMPAMAAESQEMNDEDFDMAVAEAMRGYDFDPEGTKDALAELDATLIGEPTKVEYSSNADEGVSLMSTLPSNYELVVYSIKRGNSSNYLLQWRLDCNKTETSPGTVDYISIEWDSARANYYSSSGDSKYSKVQGRNAGIVLFNVEDENMTAGTWSVGTVYVTPTKSGAMEIGSKYTHTYTRTSVTGSASSSFVISANATTGLGLTYTYTYTITTTGSMESWMLWADNTITMHL